MDTNNLFSLQVREQYKIDYPGPNVPSKWPVYIAGAMGGKKYMDQHITQLQQELVETAQAYWSKVTEVAALTEKLRCINAEISTKR